ncbi:MAG TPA: amidohydrolase family protein [Acidobacteriaceae bacterium]|jgi:hypothetical protein
MNAITLEEHCLTQTALRATDPLRDAGLAPTYHDEGLKARLLDIGAGRIADMDAAGIDYQVLSLVVCGVELLKASEAVAVAHDVNEELGASMRAYPTRFGAFATLALQDPEKAAAELEYCVNRLGFAGALINGMTDGAFLDAPRNTPVLEAAESLGVPIYIHPAPVPPAIREIYFAGLPGHRGDLLSAGGWGWHSEVATQSLRLIASGALDRFPKLKLIIGHMGENIPFALTRVDSILSNPDVNWSFTRTPQYGSFAPLKRRVGEYFRENFYITNSGFFTLPPLTLTMEVVGLDHLLFSIDYPFISNMVGRTFLDTLAKQSSLSPEVLAKFSHLNAAKLLRIKA